MHLYKSNKDLLAEYDLLVHGHAAAKKGVINLVNKSKLRYHRRFISMDGDYKIIEPNKLLLIAPSGQGKTHLVEVASKIMDFPLLKIDACSLSPTGAGSGIGPDSFKKMIRSKAKSLINTSKNYHSQQGVIDQTVVFVDEIDKLAKPSDSSGRWNIHVQENFLTMFDAKDEFSGVSFIFAGAFTGIEKQTKSSNSIGFNSSINALANELDWSEEAIKFGLIPELVGRLNGVYRLDELTKEDYKRILLDLLLPNKQDELLHYHCADFYLTPEQIESIVNKAFKSGQGVRSLKRDLNSIVQDIEFYYEDRINADTQETSQLLLENMINRYGSQNKG